MRTTLSLLLLTSIAMAQPEPTQERLCKQIPCRASFQLQQFEPEMGEDHTLTVAGPAVMRHLNFDFGAMVNYAHKPLSLFDTDDGELGDEAPSVVESQLAVDIVAAIGLFNHGEIGIAVPYVISQSGAHFDRRDLAIPAGFHDKESPTSGIGDLRVHGKAHLFGGRRGLGLAFAPVVTVPTGDVHNYTGERDMTVRPRAVAGWKAERFSAAANLGYLIRKNTNFIEVEDADGRVVDTISVQDQILYGAGASYSLVNQVEVIGELFGRMGASNYRDLDAAPAEIDVALRAEPAPRALTGLYLTLGGGAGIHKGIGSPQVRGFFGINWKPDFTDTDNDGLKDRFDQCPDEAEDRDGFDDSDGCPDKDNDQDLAPDTQDKCPNLAEDRDGFEDEDGCPDPDNDGDKIPDIQDECPFVAGSIDYRGCTAETYDSDGDGIKDANDKCKDDAEDPDGFEDEDGCPDADNDGDGVPDDFDDCPDEAEDVDEFQDDDGCPDKDNDGDGVPDAEDKCRDVFGNKAKAGCP